MIGVGKFRKAEWSSWWAYVTCILTLPSEAFIIAGSRRAAAVALAADLNIAPQKKVREQTDYLYLHPKISSTAKGLLS